jgi:hypothetical protein
MGDGNMAEIPQIDLAWEAVSALGAWSTERKFGDAVGRALVIIEQLGGKNPARSACAMPRPTCSRN